MFNAKPIKTTLTPRIKLTTETTEEFEYSTSYKFIVKTFQYAIITRLYVSSYIGFFVITGNQ